MCYIFNFFGWCFDIVQRLLTFVLCFVLCCVITVGLIVVIMAGVAYGYNYSMSEFLTFTKQDVTVYMRRGQFYDKPDIDNSRRAGGGGLADTRRSNTEPIGEGINRTVDYQDQSSDKDKSSRPDPKNLQDTWGRVSDTRKYAQVLTKYASGAVGAPDIIGDAQARPEIETEKPRLAPPTRTDSAGTAQTVMRSVHMQTPRTDMEPARAPVQYVDFSRKHPNSLSIPVPEENTKYKEIDDHDPDYGEKMPVKPQPKEDTISYVPTRGTVRASTGGGDYVEDVDEESLVYRSV